MAEDNGARVKRVSPVPLPIAPFYGIVDAQFYANKNPLGFSTPKGVMKGASLSRDTSRLPCPAHVCQEVRSCFRELSAGEKRTLGLQAPQTPLLRVGGVRRETALTGRVGVANSGSGNWGSPTGVFRATGTIRVRRGYVPVKLCRPIVRVCHQKS
mgnify:CR=1 FL=1